MIIKLGKEAVVDQEYAGLFLNFGLGNAKYMINLHFVLVPQQIAIGVDEYRSPSGNAYEWTAACDLYLLGVWVGFTRF